MYKQDCHTACGKLQTTSCTLAHRIGWATAMVRRSIKVHYRVTTAASKVAVNWIQLCYNLRTATCAFFTNLTRLKFPYENHLVEISQESYDILAHERYPTCDLCKFSVRVSVIDHHLTWALRGLITFTFNLKMVLLLLYRQPAHSRLMSPDSTHRLRVISCSCVIPNGPIWTNA